MKYVAGFYFRPGFGSVVLVRKNKPAWQAGRLNGVGGKVEGNECSSVAMAREFAEETGAVVPPEKWTSFLTMSGPGWDVDFFYAFGSERVATMESEEIGVYSISGLFLNPVSPSVIPNLRWALSMALDTPLTPTVRASRSSIMAHTLNNNMTETPNWDVLNAAFGEVRETRRRITRYSNEVTEMAIEVVRHADASKLRRLKRILQNFDSIKGSWKN